MKIAITACDGRVSPVFDAARRMVVFEVEDGRPAGRREEPLDEDIVRKVEQIAGAGIEVLVCGAISQPVAVLLAMRGVRFQPFIAGDIDEVVAAGLAGELDRPRFAMPGCCGRRLRLRGGRARPGCGRRRVRW